MSYFPTDIPFMSDEELKENGLKKPYKKPEIIDSKDIVPVVRCKDCKHVRKWRSEESAKKFGQVYECVKSIIPCPDPDDFCSLGKCRKE